MSIICLSLLLISSFSVEVLPKQLINKNLMITIVELYYSHCILVLLLVLFKKKLLQLFVFFSLKLS